MLSCLAHLPTCIWDQFIGWAGTWPFWVIVACVVFVLGVAYRLAGWPGVLVVASGGAYLLGRFFRRRDDEPDWDAGDSAPRSGPGQPLGGPARREGNNAPKFPRLRNVIDRLRPKR